MKRIDKNGFVTALVAIVVALVVLGGAFYVYENKSPAENNNLPLDNSESSSNTINSEMSTETTQDLATTSVSVLPVSEVQKVKENASLAAAFENKKTISAETVSVPAEANKPAEVAQEPTGDPVLEVSLGDDVPPVLLVHDAKRVPLLKVLLKASNGDVEVSKVVIERKGFASDRVFSEIGVMGIDSERAPDANHQYQTRESFTVKAGEEMELVLFGNIASDLTAYEGQTPSLSLVKIDADAPVEGDLPITSKTFTVNSNISIGTLTLTQDSFDPAMNRSFYINDKDVTFTAVKASIGGQEAIVLNNVTWYQAGSASINDVKNVKTYVVYKGDVYSFDSTPDETGKYYSSDLGDGIKIGKGETADIYVKGDIGTTGSDRTIDFDVYGYWDISGVGATYKQEVDSTGGDVDGPASEGEFSNDQYPFFNGYAHTISSGAAQSIQR